MDSFSFGWPRVGIREQTTGWTERYPDQVHPHLLDVHDSAETLFHDLESGQDGVLIET